MLYGIVPFDFYFDDTLEVPIDGLPEYRKFLGENHELSQMRVSGLVNLNEFLSKLNALGYELHPISDCYGRIYDFDSFIENAQEFYLDCDWELSFDFTKEKKPSVK